MDDIMEERQRCVRLLENIADKDFTKLISSAVEPADINIVFKYLLLAIAAEMMTPESGDIH